MQAQLELVLDEPNTENSVVNSLIEIPVYYQYLVQLIEKLLIQQLESVQK